MKRLSELAIGQKAEILSFEKDEIFIKLMEMGCVPGEIVKVEQRVPVRIELTRDNNLTDVKRLLSGLNVECEVDY